MGWNSRLLLLCFTFVAFESFSQTDRYIVLFKDKSGTQFSTSQPLTFLSSKAVERRLRHGTPVTEADLPVNTNYVQGVKSAGADVFFTTRWLNGVLIQCESSLIPSIQSLSYVKSVELIGINASLMRNRRTKSPLKEKGAKAGVTDSQLSMIGLDEMHAAGVKGEGVTIAVLDAGFPGVNTAEPFQHLFDNGQIDLTASKDYVYNSGDVFQFDDHGTQVFSVIAGLRANDFTGGAPEADFQLYVTEEVPTEYRIEEYNWVFAIERADSAGVDVVQSSLGYYDFDVNSMDYFQSQMDGQTTIISRAAQMAADRGIVIVVSAGNEGNNSWKIITAPADAEDVLAVGSVTEQLQRSGSSSTGPTADKRIKPDVAALGVNTSVILPNGNSGKASGTSLAAPLITSLVAGLLQKFPMMTNRQIIEAVRMSASHASNPNNELGYGIPNYMAAVAYLNEIMTKRLFDIAPNPSFADSVRIRCLFPQEVTNCNVEFISIDGRSVLKRQLGFSAVATETFVSTSSLASGMYIVRLTWDDKNFIFRFVKA